MDLSLTALSKLLILTPQRVDQLVKHQIIPKKGRGQYGLTEAVHGYIKYLREQIEHLERGGEKLRAAQLSLAQSKADLAAIAAAKAKGDAVSLEDVEKEFGPLFNTIAQIIRGMPKRTAHQTGHPELEPMIATFAEQILNELAGLQDRLERARTHSKRRAAQSAQTPKAAPKASRKRVGRPKSGFKRRAERRGRKVVHRKG